MESFCLFTLPLIGQNPSPPEIEYRNGMMMTQITDKIEFFEDQSRTLRIEDILTDSISALFSSIESNVANFGITESTVWCRFSLRNSTGAPCYLQIKRFLLFDIQIFSLTDRGLQLVGKYGLSYAATDQSLKTNFHTHRLSLGTTDSLETFYMKFNSPEAGALEIPLQMGNLVSLYADAQFENRKFGLFFGILISAFIFSLCSFIKTKTKEYFYYCLHQLFLIWVNDMAFTGFLHNNLWPSHPEINLLINAFVAIMFVLTSLFVINFLNTKVKAPICHTCFYILFGLSGIIIFLVFLSSFWLLTT